MSSKRKLFVFRRRYGVVIRRVSAPRKGNHRIGIPAIRLAGVETKVALFVLTRPYSGAIFVQAFPCEGTETFWEGHRRAFEFFGDVPQRISYDNSAIAVIEVLQGRERKRTREFLRLQSGSLFQEHFCLVRRPNESIRLIVTHQSEVPTLLFSLEGRPHLAWVQVETTDVSSYQTLLEEAAS